MDMYTKINIFGAATEIERLNDELNCFNKVYQNCSYIDEDCAKEKDEELVGTIFHYGMQKDLMIEEAQFFYSPITWNKIRYEYYLYEKFKKTNSEKNYEFTLVNIQLDFLFKKSLEQNCIKDLDDYFHFYENEYDKKLDFDELENILNGTTYSFSKWWSEVIYPLIGVEIMKGDKEIVLEYECKYSTELLFEILSKNYNLAIMVIEDYEGCNNLAYSYYFDGKEIDKKSYGELLRTL